MTSTFQGQLSRERRRSGLFAMEIERLSRGFAAEGIECVALKGAGLTQNVYTSPAERFLSDVDLLVSPDRVDATLAHLLEHGYANPWSMEALLGYYEQGTVKPVIAETFSFDKAADAHHFIQDRKNMGKVLLVP